MKNNIGIIKEIDGLGRLVIPKEMRELFKFESTVELLVTADGVLIRNPEYILIKKQLNRMPLTKKSPSRLAR